MRPNEFQGHPETVAKRYRAVCKQVVDGDTFTMMVDLGFYTYVNIRVRLNGVDTAELRDRNPVLKEQARVAKTFAEERLLNKPCLIITEKDTMSFDRWIADVYFYPTGDRWNPVNLAVALLEANLAVKV